MNLRGAKPIADHRVKDFIVGLNPTNDLYNNDIQDQFTNDFYNWINSSKLNNLIGLDKFPIHRLVAGTAQTFDHFYWRHKNRTFRFFRGEFMYHSAVLKHGGVWAYLDDRRLQPNDALIISVPFSDYGSQHTHLEFLLHNCNAMDIPVLLDFAYYPCTKNITLDLTKYNCVQTVTFSLSKAFYGAEFLRVGLRLEREDTDDGIDLINSVEMVNRISLSIASSLIKNYSIDHNWLSYGDLYKEVCKEYNLKNTDCVMFGLGGDEYKEYNRGTKVNRVCVSEIIGEKNI